MGSLIGALGAPTVRRRLAALLLIGLAFGCTKDRSLTDYNNEQFRDQLARYQKANGTYTGLLTSAISNKPVGALSVVLTARAAMAPAQAGSGPTATVHADLTLENFRTDEVSTDTAIYDPDSGIYQATFSGSGGSGSGGSGTGETTDMAHAMSGGASSGGDSFTLNAVVSGGHLVGSLQASAFKTANFDLTVNGGAIDDLAQRNGLKINDSSLGGQFKLISYIGQTAFTEGRAGVVTSKAVRIEITQPLVADHQLYLYNFLVPVKNVTAAFVYDPSAQVTFGDPVVSGSVATWDLNSGLLSGQTSVLVVDINSTGGKGMTVSLNVSCQTTVNQSPASITCEHITTQLGTVASTTAQEPASPAQDQNPGDSCSSGNDPDCTANPVVRTYYGSTSGFSKVVLTAKDPAKSRFQDLIELLVPEAEEYINMALQFSDKIEASEFKGAKWDKLSGTVHGDYSGTSDNHNQDQSIDCTGFFFQTRGPFSCTYTSYSPTLRTLTINLR